MLLKRKINFFYRCHAIKSLKIDGNVNNFREIKVELYDGNDPEWINPEMKKMIPHIQFERENYDLLGPKNIKILGNAANHEERYGDGEAVIIPAKNALEEYVEHSVYLCQPKRSFRPIQYLGFYANGKINKNIPQILGQIEEIVLSPDAVKNSKYDEKTKKRLLELIKSLERIDDMGRLYDSHKVFFLSPPDSSKTLTLKRDIINDTKTKNGRGTAFTQNQRYVPISKLKINPKRTSELIK